MIGIPKQKTVESPSIGRFSAVFAFIKIKKAQTETFILFYAGNTKRGFDKTNFVGQNLLLVKQNLL